MLSKLPGELLYHVLDYLDTKAWYSLSKTCKYIRFYAINKIHKQTIKLIECQGVFKQEKEILYWLVNEGYLILHTIEEKEINKRYIELWFFYLDKKYIENMYHTNIKMMYQIQKIADHLIDL